jgi:hypothetical protein
MAPNFSGIRRAAVPVVDLELVPTEAELLARDRAVNAKKNSNDWDGLTVHFAHSEEVQRSRGVL